jgi:hypothetical protein
MGFDIKEGRLYLLSVHSNIFSQALLASTELPYLGLELLDLLLCMLLVGGHLLGHEVFKLSDSLLVLCYM